MALSLAHLGYSLLDQGLVPDFLVRRAIRHLLRQRLASLAAARPSKADRERAKWAYVAALADPDTAIATDTDRANAQHYEGPPTAFMQACLGPRMKYSCCLYPAGREATTSLADAEQLMLDLYCDRAHLQDGMHVLDLGCGWGSLGLFLAEKYPASTITALSNSKTQKLYIDRVAAERGLTNLEVVTGDVNVYDFKGVRFDRILSIEMFEHMKNYDALLAKLATWLKPNALAQGAHGALVFVHIFCHKDTPYNFESDDGWMAQNFFSGGTMPSFDLFLHFQASLQLVQSWYLPGTHYQRTCEDWLRLQDAHRFVGDGDAAARTRYHRFRVFFMACAELFGTAAGEEWGVGHYLFRGRD